YLVLACCYRYVHGSAVIEPDQHSWAGFVLLEPKLTDALVKRLRGYRQSELKLLSVLPSAFLHWVLGRIWPTVAATDTHLQAPENPKDREQYWQESGSIGSAALRERYSAVRYFQFGKTCR